MILSPPIKVHTVWDFNGYYNKNTKGKIHQADRDAPPTKTSTNPKIDKYSVFFSIGSSKNQTRLIYRLFLVCNAPLKCQKRAAVLLHSCPSAETNLRLHHDPECAPEERR